MMCRFYIVLLLKLISLLAAYSSVANGAADTSRGVPIQFVMQVSSVGYYNPGMGTFTPGSATFTIADGGCSYSSTTMPMGVTKSATIKLLPNITYTMTMSAQTCAYKYAVYIAPKAGVKVFINDVEQYGVTYTPASSPIVAVPPSVTVRIEDGMGANPGESLPLSGRGNIWAVGLGSLANGRTAGLLALPLKTSGYDWNNVQASDLIYNKFNAEVKTFSGQSSSRFQILAVQCLADIEPLPSGRTGFMVKFYDRSQLTSSLAADGLWGISEGALPFVEYCIESASGKVRFTRKNRINSPGRSDEIVTNSEIRKADADYGMTEIWQIVEWTSNTAPLNEDLPVGDRMIKWRYVNNDLDSERYIFDASGNIASCTKFKYTHFPWGNELVQSVEGPETDVKNVSTGWTNPLVTSYDYYNDPADYGSYMQKKYDIFPSGKWVLYKYYSDAAKLGNLQATYEPYADKGAGPLSADYDTGLVTQFDYVDDMMKGRSTRLSSTIASVGGEVIARKTTSYSGESFTEVVRANGTDYSVVRNLVRAETRNYYNSTQFLTTVDRYFREDTGMAPLVAGSNGGQSIYEGNRGFYPLKPYDSVSPDNTTQVWTYSRGYRTSGNWGFTPSPEGLELKIGKMTLHGYTPVEGVSTFNVLIKDSAGVEVGTESGLFVEGYWRLLQSQQSSFIHGFVPFEVISASGGDTGRSWVSSRNTWSGGRLVGTTDGEGIERVYEMTSGDWVKANILVAKPGVNPNIPSSNIRTEFIYDGCKRVLRSGIPAKVAGDPDFDVRTAAYDVAGRPTRNTVAGPSGDLITRYEYSGSAGVKTTKTILPTLAESVADFYYDERKKSEYGSALYGAGLVKNYTYGIEGSTGYQWAKEDPPHHGYVLRVFDWLGRVVRETTPGYDGKRIATVYAYDPNTGNLLKQQQVKADLSDNASFASTPLSSAIIFEYDSYGRKRLVGVDVDGSGSITTAGNDRIKEYAYSAFTDSSTEPGSTIIWDQVSEKTYTDGSQTPVVLSTSIRQVGSLNSGSSAAPLITGRSKVRSGLYDGSNADATTTVVTSRLNTLSATKSIVTKSPGATINGEVKSVNGYVVSETSTTGVTTVNSYDEYGRKMKVSGRESVLESFAFYPGTSVVQSVRNLIFNPNIIGGEWQTFVYDLAGRLVMKQRKNVGGMENTRFDYDSRGNVLHVWGNASIPTETEYDDFNRRKKLRQYRGSANWDATTWPGGSLTADLTEWSYDVPTGLIKNKTYPNNGQVAEVSFEYNNGNQVSKRKWGRGVDTEYTYYDQSTPSFGALGELKSVSYPNSGSVGQMVLTPSVSYQYNRSGKIASVSDATASSVDQSDIMRLNYRPDDLQLDTIKLPSFFGAEGKVLTYKYGVGTQIGWPVGYQLGTSVVSNQYQALTYGYDGASGRINSITAWNSNVQEERSFVYQYHPNSNFLDSIVSGQYARTYEWESWRDVINSVDNTWAGVRLSKFTYGYDWHSRRTGEATTGSTVGILDPGNNIGIIKTYLNTPRGEVEYSDGFKLTSDAALWDPSQNRGAEIPSILRDWEYDGVGNRKSESRSGGSLRVFATNGLNQYSSTTDSSPISPTVTTSFTYDADGNLTSDGYWTYYWDAENRLQRIQHLSTTISFVYDYLNRRVSKTVSTTGVKTIFLYDGWNIIAEFSESSPSNLGAQYVWGLDVSGSTQGAGGVGGLLWGSRSGLGSFLPVYDANGNIRGYLNSLGQFASNCDYSPTGEYRVFAGSRVLPFGYASKYYDVESDLYQYNNRYYSPILGRFISRDPIGEDGGINLYGYCGNDGVNRWDMLGNYYFDYFYANYGNGGSTYPFHSGGTANSNAGNRCEVWVEIQNLDSWGRPTAGSSFVLNPSLSVVQANLLVNSAIRFANDNNFNPQRLVFNSEGSLVGITREVRSSASAGVSNDRNVSRQESTSASVVRSEQSDPKPGVVRPNVDKSAPKSLASGAGIGMVIPDSEKGSVNRIYGTKSTDSGHRVMNLRVPVAYSGPGASSKNISAFEASVRKYWAGKVVGDGPMAHEVASISFVAAQTDRSGKPLGLSVYIAEVGSARSVYDGGRNIIGFNPEDPRDYVGAHEFGHYVGLIDQYKDVRDSSAPGGWRTEYTQPGAENHLMGGGTGLDWADYLPIWRKL